MKKYLLIDNFEETETIKTEEELRKLYDLLMDELIFNWKDCQDEKIKADLQKEKEEVFTTDIHNVIRAIKDIDGFYEIIELQEEN